MKLRLKPKECMFQFKEKRKNARQKPMKGRK